jgi:hypothetical protein
MFAYLVVQTRKIALFAAALGVGIEDLSGDALPRGCACLYYTHLGRDIDGAVWRHTGVGLTDKKSRREAGAAHDSGRYGERRHAHSRRGARVSSVGS